MKRIILAAVFVIAVAVGSLAYASNHGHVPTAPASISDNVDSFNDGFADSKQDDCEQGFKAACEWLKAAGLPQ